MKLRSILFLTAVLMSSTMIGAEEPLHSGPQVGDGNDRRGFRPLWVSGPCAGKSLCPV